MRMNITLTFMRDGVGYTELMDLLTPIMLPTKRLETTRSTFDIIYLDLPSHAALVMFSYIISKRFDDLIRYEMEYAS